MVDLATFGMENLRGEAMDIAVYVIWGVVAIAVIYFLWIKYQNKKIYIYPVRIHRQRNNGMVKEINTFGGYIKKGQITKFVIKMGKFKKKDLDSLPDSSMMDEDNRVYYWQISPESPLVQSKRSFIIEQVLVPNENFIEPTKELKDETINRWAIDLLEDENFKDKTEEDRKIEATRLFQQSTEIERTKLIDITNPTYSPVPTDLKQQAMSDINNYRNTLGVDVNKQFAYFVTGIIALVIIAVVLFYIAANEGDIPIITELMPLLFFKFKKSKHK
jgi:hypothetical protein